ncbi:structural protein [Vibrio sp. SCSIO 43137]|uniref:structural protein n=1 Tax=Vibrio sp. SCSIO 43137 TaxID=3021011 RepID=UPI0023082D31|nr:structural protein [Vibrio sp. SCSIO 43137]WCE31114.1 structural protein [Vibrio sp. SCSIO 43137]
MNNKHLWMLATAATLLLALKGSTMVRGIRNNNPGNIEDNGTPWRGRVGNDGRFIIFDHATNGIRAMARTLFTYRNKYQGLSGIGGQGFDTIHEVINRWAPAVENDTEAYIAHAEKALNLDRYTRIPMERYPELIKTIIKHENGVQPYSDEVIHAGIQAA